MDSQLAKTTYIRPSVVELPGYFEYRRPNEFTTEIDQYISLDASAVPQVNTITIVAGTVGDVYSVNVQVDTLVFAVAYIQQTGDNAAVIASRLGAFLDKFEFIETLIVGTLITITSNRPGMALTLSNAQSTNTANVDLTLIEAAVPSASGGATVGVLTRKVSTTRLVYGVDVDGNPTIDTTIEWFNNNDATPFTTAPRGKVTHPVALDSMQLANGV